METSHILLVEDNPDDVELARRAFVRSGVPVELFAARDGQEAIERLKSAVDLPEVVLLDLNLPRVGGIQVLEWMRSTPRTRLVPVVILSTSSQPADIAASYRAGANSYISKPVDFLQFAAVIRGFAHYWVGLNQPPPSGLR